MFGKKLSGFYYFVAAVCLLSSAAWAQTAGKVLSVEEMRADYDVLRRIVRESHPNLYRGTSEESAERNWRETRGRIEKPLTQRQFVNLLNPVFSQYNDGHTYLELPLDGDEYKNYVKNGGLFFPFKIWAKNERLFVAANHGTLELPRGTEIVSINGKRASDVFGELTKAMSGDTTANRAATVERLFGLMLWQKFDPGSEFALRIRRPASGKTETIKAAGISGEALEKMMFGDKAVDAYELTPEIMVLEVNKMQSKDEVKKFIDETFARIKEKNYPALVIDIRRNGGGNSVVGDWVFEYLTRKRYRQSGIKEIRLSSYLTENNKFYRDWTAKLKTANPVVGDKIVLKSDDAEDEAAPDTSKWIYPGKVYLLTTPRTYSSGFMLAETFKCYKFGTMLGESLGSHRNLTGELMRFTLPNSKIVGYVASSHFYPPCYQKAQTDFLEPDVKIEQTLEDLTAGKDTVLEYIKKTIAKN
jgi:C-terminal processing protease CtpA/Prc